jgi:hypothetical protein
VHGVGVAHLEYGVNVLVLNPDPFARLGLGWMA